MSVRSDLEAKCKELAEHLASDMAEENLRGKTLTLKLKLTTFEVRTRAVTLPRYIHTAEEILNAGLKLLRAELPVEIRLMGLRMSHFYEEPKRAPDQPSLQDVLNRRENNKEKQEPEQHKEQNNTENNDHDELCLVHTSQVLSAGDEVELTLRDWQDPSSFGAGGSGGGLHMPTTALDDLARGTTLPTNQNKSIPNTKQGGSNPVDQDKIKTWICQACTFENPKRQLLCEMCGCSKTGTRPGDGDGSGAVAGNQRRGKKRSQTTIAASGASSILDFCVPQKTQKKE